MKSLPFVVVLLGAVSFAAIADDQLRNAQTELKTQGFYYGEINGETSSETTAAIRRYQIRNGLEVTGTLTKETLDSLKLGAPPESPATATQPPINLRRDETVEDSDKNFLRREEAKKRTSPPATVVPAPPADEPPATSARRSDVPSSDFAEIFAETPYENAPREVQESTLRRAQNALASRGIYRSIIDGAPGPATEEALLSFQRSSRLPLSGRLDLETLAALRLLPGRAPAPLRGFQPGDRDSTAQRVYRGIWIH